MMRKLIFNILFAIRLPHLLHYFNRINGRVPILLFHDVSPVKNENTGAITPEEFEELITFLKSKYEIKDLRQLKNESAGSRACYITFDDGMFNFQKYALDIIVKHNIPITLFVPPKCMDDGFTWNLKYFDMIKESQANALTITKEDFSEVTKITSTDNTEISNDHRLLNWEEVKAINKNPLIDIQSHSNNHYFLSMLNSEKQAEELAVSKEILENSLEKNIDMIAYPMGDYDENTIKLAKENYDFGFKTGDSLVDLKNLKKYEIPRIHLHSPGSKDLYLRINGVHSFVRKILPF